MSSSAPSPAALHHWRPLVSALAGLAVGAVAANADMLTGARLLLGWNAAAFVYAATTWGLLVTAPADVLRARARREDENRFVLTGFILAAVLFSLAAIVFALKQAKAPQAGGFDAHGLILGLSVSTLVLSWLVVQSLFALHYAHLYFGDRDGDGAPDGGIIFPGGDPKTYRDFIYVSVCVGATCQVSDFNITTTRLRTLVTAHALVAFTFNTMILALGINILGNLMGQ